MRLLVLAAISTVTAGVIGTVVARQHWSFLLVMVTMLVAVVVLGSATVVAAMTWPQKHGRPDGHPAGWF